MTRRSPMNDRYTTERTGGATKRGAGSMKPATSAASSVRVQSKKPTGGNSRSRAMAAMNADAGKSKEEKKLERAKRREQEDELYTASSILCNKDEKYQMWRRVWWACLIGAVVFTALSWASLSSGVGGAVVSVVVLVLAYVTIIAALVIDVGPVRKRRNVYRDKVNAMTKKQVDRILADSYIDRQATDAAKKARKEAKKAGKDPETAYQQAYNAYVENAHTAGKGAASAGATGTATTAVATDSTAVEQGSSNDSSAGNERRRGILFGKRKADKTTATPVDDDGNGMGDVAAPASEQQAARTEAEEAARKEAAAKAAREFAASRRSGTGK